MPRSDKHVALEIAFEENSPYDPSTPEKNLLRALLTTALADVRKSGNVRKLALEFFLSTDDDYIFSFRSVCNYLGIDPDRVLMAAGLKPRPRDRERIHQVQ